MSWIDKLTGRRTRQELEHLRREVTRLRELTESGEEASMRTITGLEDQVIQLDRDGRIEYVNTSLASALRMSKDQLLGQPLSFADVLPWKPGVMQELAAAARADPQGKAQTEIRHENDEGRERFHKVSAHAEPDGRLQLRVEDMTELRTLEQTFSRYVSPKVVEKMKALPAKDFFRAERVELTVLFADLRGFTRTAQGLSAVEVHHLLNEYLEAMIDVADRHEAFVDKVVADEVMLLFGAPMPDPDHAARALQCGLEMLEAQVVLCDRWRELGRPEVGLGVGVNSGEAVVGNVGSRKRMDYTVIGHAVNVASRLCDTARAGQLLVSAATRDAVADSQLAAGLTFEDAGQLSLKGVSEPLTAYDVRAAS